MLYTLNILQLCQLYLKNFEKNLPDLHFLKRFKISLAKEEDRIFMFRFVANVYINIKFELEGYTLKKLNL